MICGRCQTAWLGLIVDDRRHVEELRGVRSRAGLRLRELEAEAGVVSLQPRLDGIAFRLRIEVILGYDVFDRGARRE